MGAVVSVVIPAYNAGRTIAAAIESVLRQTYADYEIIVVDDASTDDTAPKVQTFGARVKYVKQGHGGVSAARNRGIAEARGEYVAFLDADDLWLSRKLEAQMAVVRDEPRLDGVHCSAYLVNDRLEVVEARYCSPERDSCLNYLLFQNLPSFGSALLVRKATIEALGGFATDLMAIEDWDLACRLAQRGRVRSVPEFLVLYRQHAGNRSHAIGPHIEAGARILTRFFADPAVPPELRQHQRRIWARFYAMVAGGYLRNREWRSAVEWALRAVVTSPAVTAYLIGTPVRHARRAWLARQRLSFADEVALARI